jgi:hypothetical protein
VLSAAVAKLSGRTPRTSVHLASLMSVYLSLLLLGFSSHSHPISTAFWADCRFRVADHFMARYLASLDAVLRHDMPAALASWASKDLDDELPTHKASTHSAASQGRPPSAPPGGQGAPEAAAKREGKEAGQAGSGSGSGLCGAALVGPEREEVAGAGEVGAVGKGGLVEDGEAMMQQVEGLIGEAPLVRLFCTR